MRKVLLVGCLLISLSSVAAAQNILTTFSAFEFPGSTTSIGFSVYPTNQPNSGWEWEINNPAPQSVFNATSANLPVFTNMVTALTNGDSAYEVALLRNNSVLVELNKSDLLDMIITPTYANIPQISGSPVDFAGYNISKFFLGNGLGATSNNLVFTIYGSPASGSLPEPTAIVLLIMGSILFIRIRK